MFQGEILDWILRPNNNIELKFFKHKAKIEQFD